MGMIGDVSDRSIALGPGVVALPERLLLAHARGEVLLVCGAGVSMPAGLPNFEELVVDVYGVLDPPVHQVMEEVRADPARQADGGDLEPQQVAEVRQFAKGEYDVVLGMLERRLDGSDDPKSNVRRAVASILSQDGARPAPIHRAIMRLADRGGAVSVVTTNFDLLLERAVRPRPTTYALAGIPRPTRRSLFSGVFHAHGALTTRGQGTSDLVLTDQDFGEFYLRRRVVPDFIYDAARLYHLVLVGYSASDAPMRYLLNAVAADGTRFLDIKERFCFVGEDSADLAVLADWHARGITPIPYSSDDGHAELHDVLRLWAKLSPINGRPEDVYRTMRRIVRRPLEDSEEVDRELFAHLFRRGDRRERWRMADIVASTNAELGWLTLINEVARDGNASRGR
ncbi:MAG: SIR2 family protein [Gammaproteobacteria bacterium]|nr:SIR2 family protein [Gammaproteobacteria bacterium]